MKKRVKSDDRNIRVIRRSAALLLMAGSLMAFLLGVGADDAGAQDHVAGQRTVVITGANRGLGLEFARQYAAAGWQVIGTARRPDAATDLKAIEVRVMQLDVADDASVERLAHDLGDQPIDLLINNAGVAFRGETFADAKFDEVERTLAVNTIGPMRVTRALLPNLRGGKAKRIVSISSGLGSIHGNEGGGFYGYRESKAALNMFMRSLAADLRDAGFICIVMSPGWVKTDMGGPEAPLTPEESIKGMREVIDRLTSEDSGQFWSYDGKQLKW
jgi:NAD(P)-dependent dehydrogenase (short-subunit alcohol dehydrogenase family)